MTAEQEAKFYVGGWMKHTPWIWLGLGSLALAGAIFRSFAGTHTLFWEILKYVIALGWLSLFAWNMWTSRKYPIVTLSSEKIEWRKPFTTKLHSIPRVEILSVEKITPYSMVLKTSSQREVRIPIEGLSKENKDEIRKRELPARS